MYIEILAAIVAALGYSPVIILAAESKVLIKAFRKAISEGVPFLNKIKEYKNGLINAFIYGVLGSVIYYSGLGDLLFGLIGLQFPIVISGLGTAIIFGFFADEICDELFAILDNFDIRGIKLSPIKR